MKVSFMYCLTMPNELLHYKIYTWKSAISVFTLSLIPVFDLAHLITIFVTHMYQSFHSHTYV